MAPRTMLMVPALEACDDYDQIVDAQAAAALYLAYPVIAHTYYG